MSSILQQLRDQAALAAQTGPNMTEAQKGGGGARLLPEGYAFAQLVEYVEYGSQPQMFEGVAKEPAQEFCLGFALSGVAPDPTDPTKTIPYSNTDGTPYLLRTWSMAMSRNDKAKAFLLFKAMNWKGTATHFGQLLGEKFLVKIVTVTGKAQGSKPRSSIDLKSVLPPLDVVSRMPYPIAESPDSMYRAFFWEHPTLEAWNALKIEGEYEAKDGKPAESKNYIQNDILSALDFEGSALQILLMQTGTAYVVPPKPAAPVAAAAPPAMAAPAAPPTTPAAAPITPVAAPVGVVMPAAVAPAIVAPAPVSVVSPVAVVPAPVVAAVPVAAPAVASPPFTGGVVLPPALPVAA